MKGAAMDTLLAIASSEERHFADALLAAVLSVIG
jgi:hypothetical protein